jgi:uncharacterized DUF497 family protein
MGETDDFEWDDTKEFSNIAKHGLSLKLAAELFISDVWVEFEAKFSRSDSSRTIAIGPVRGRLLACIYTLRGRKRRVISFRPASRRERRAYEEATRRSR